MLEVWKEVLNGYYEVSNIGRVRRVMLWSGKRVERYPWIYLDPCGYLRLNVSIDGKHGNKRVHCLVAAAFLGPCPEGYELHHRNFDRADARAINLEYITHLDNVRESFAAGMHDRRGERNGRAKLTVDEVRCIRLRWSVRRSSSTLFISHNAGEYQVSYGTIARVVQGIGWEEAA